MKEKREREREKGRGESGREVKQERNTEREGESELAHAYRKGIGRRNGRVKVNEEKGTEKECPREDRICTHAREKERKEGWRRRRGGVGGV